ncbi:MAG: hypothetical protein PF447_04735 [Spirochaetaceae bacterium]|nr:hypothetical protein [Spirochaetaceae bacterium]
MIKNTKVKVILFILLVLFILSLIILMLFISPEELVDIIGIHRGYLLAFLVSFFGGFSSGGSISFISLLITLTAGGLNPLILGTLSGISLALGDMILFFTGSKGRELIGGKWEERIDKLAKILVKRERLKQLIPFIAYLYMGFAPLPNDILLLFLAAMEFPREKMNIIIILGDITFALMITLVVSKGLTSIIKIY